MPANDSINDGCGEHKDVRELFRQQGMRCTRQRAVIYEALRESKAHPTAEQLLELVRRKEPGLSLATVYNALDSFVSVGLVRRIASRRGNGPSRYDADMSGHVHLVEADGTVLDVPADLSSELLGALSDDLARRIERATGRAISGMHIELIAGSSQAAAKRV